MRCDVSINNTKDSFRFYLEGVGASSLAQGLQIVLFPWLLVGVLGESAERVGYAQMALMLPQLLFILLGGVFSDKRSLGLYLFRLYMLYSIPCLILLVSVWQGWLSYELMLLFGICFGCITAFVQPARETLLSRVANTQLQQAVAKASFIQFSAQSVGIILAGYLDDVGLLILIALQITLLVTSGYLLRRCLDVVPDEPKQRNRSTWKDMLSGLELVRQDTRLLQLMMVVAATGFLGFGLYLVAMPILTREVYHQGAAFFAWIQFSFMFGVILSNVFIIRFVGRFTQPGRMLLISLLIRGGLLVGIAMHPPSWLLFLLVLLWGAASGVAMMLGRSMTHEASPQAYRARVVSVYQLALFGAAPIGAWVSGHTMGAIGVLPAIGVLGVLTILVGVVAMLFSDLWQPVK
ncbi:MAG TPA: MFS transporter [Porticoccus sp.]|nr:MFS transporter [Porticoccus sp.]